MKITSVCDIAVRDRQAGILPTYWGAIPALVVLVSVAILAALTGVMQSASAQKIDTGQGSIAPSGSGAPASPDCSSDWTVVSSPNPGTAENHLLSITTVSTNDVWAVGYFLSGPNGRTLTEHWNGSTWTTISSPNPGAGDTRLLGVAAVSNTDVWAVGYHNNGTADRTLTEHWNGSAWSIVSSSNQGTGDNVLKGVTAISSNNVWAVGSCNNCHSSSNLLQTLVGHWNGTVWSITYGPDLGDGNNILYGVDVASSSPEYMWAVGAYSYISNPVRTLVAVWNGVTWSTLPSPVVGNGDNYLLGVSALSDSDIWTVGEYYNGAAYRNLIEHWNGTTLSIVPSPNVGPGNNVLYGVTAVSANDVWAVGYFLSGSAAHTLIEHWNGTVWSIVPSPTIGTGESYLGAAVAVSSGDIWAVGYYRNGSPYQTLAERYNPCTGSPTATVTPGGPTSTPTRTPVPIPSQCALQFEDVPNPSVFYVPIECLACRGILNGYACGGQGEPCNAHNDPYFRPANRLTRGQVAKILAIAAGLNNPVSGQSFQDVPITSTFYTYIERLHALGVMSGFPCGGTNEPCLPPANLPYFRPNNVTTRGQLAKLDSNTAGFSDGPTGQYFQDVPVNSAYYAYTYRLVIRTIMSGYPCGGPAGPCVPPANLPYFKPGVVVVRGQTAKIVANTFFPSCQAPAK